MYHPSYSFNLQLIKKYTPFKKLAIIDYGCGNGILLDVIPPEVISSYVGFEVSDAALKVAQARTTKKVLFYKINTQKLPKLGKTNSVDLVILIGVLQYLNDQEITHVLTEAKRVLKPGGVIIASCVVDHFLYKLINLYQFILPNSYVNRKRLLAESQSLGFTTVFAQEKGLLLGPLFSHGFVIFFDALDKLIFRNQGKLGPIGIFARQCFQPLMKLEYYLPFDYGYTLYIVLKK